MPQNLTPLALRRVSVCCMTTQGGTDVGELSHGLPHPYLCCSHNSIVTLEELLQRRGAITLCSSHRCARLQHHLFAETTACRLGCSDDVLAVLLGTCRSSVSTMRPCRTASILLACVDRYSLLAKALVPAVGWCAGTRR